MNRAKFLTVGTGLNFLTVRAKQPRFGMPADIARYNESVLASCILYTKSLIAAAIMPSKSKNYNILQSVETVNLDDGVEATTQPRKPRISPPFRCTKRVRFLAVIGSLVSFVAVLLIVTFSLVAVIVGRNDSGGGGGIGPTSVRASQALGLLVN